MTKLLFTNILVIIISILGLQESYAQTRNIIGKVMNGITGKPITGITLEIKGVSEKVKSSSLGYYSIAIPDTMEIITFADFEGMDILEIKSMGNDEINIYLSEIDMPDLSIEDLMKIKVKVSSSESETVFHTPSTVSVIDREMLNNYNFLSVAEMLRTAVGIDIYQTNLDDNVATSRGVLQNYYANKILVMIENIPTYQPIYGNTNLDRLDVNDIERIEVLRGPASVLYGSNAYMGVVNIILRKDKNGDVNVRLGSGYHRFGAAGANVTLSKKDFSLFVSGNSSFESQKPYELMGKRQDLYNGDSVYMYRGEIKSTNFNILSTYKSITLMLNKYEYQHTFMGINPSFISGGGKPMNDRGTLVAIKFYEELGPKIKFIGDVAYDYYKRDWASNQDGSNALMLKGSRIFAITKFNFDIAPFLDIESGIDLERRMQGEHVMKDMLKDTIIRSNLKDADNIDEISAFVQMHFKSKFFNVLGGIRYTNNSFSGGNFSGRVSAIATFNKTSSFKLIFGQSFRAPTMLELYFDHPTVVGNLNLKPEKANSYELAYVYGKKTMFFQTLIYYNKLEQLIQRYTPESGPPSGYENISPFKSYGFEFEAKYRNPGLFNAFISYNYMAGLDEMAKENYALVPDHTFKFGINKDFVGFFASINGYAVTSVYGNPKLNIPIDGQYMLDIHIGYKHTISAKAFDVQHTFSAKNITASQMLIPEYIRQTDNINSQATTAYGRRFIYTLTVSF